MCGLEIDKAVRPAWGNQSSTIQTIGATMSQRILERISRFFTFGDSPAFADWDDFAATALKSISALALAWAILLLFFV